MCAAVQDVHHRHRQTIAGDAAQKTVQRNVLCDRCSSCSSNGHCQNSIGAQLGLVLGAVCIDHCLIHSVDVRGIHARQNLVDDGIDVLHCLGDTLAQITGLVAVTQFQRFELAGGCAAGGSTSADRTVDQIYLSLYSGVSSGIQNLSSDNLFNFQIIHDADLL